MKYQLLVATLLLSLGQTAPLLAETFSLSEEDMVGSLKTATSTEEDTLIDIARRYDVGFNEIVIANPTVDAWLPKNAQVTIPTQYLLPAVFREGVVVNLAEMRLYYYPKVKKGAQQTVETYPVSIGRGDWNTPLVSTKVKKKITDPVWYPPKSIREEHAENGDVLPEVVPAGEDNPLGKYALYLTTASYLIHGTNKSYGIGMQVTHGCIRLYPEDIELLYKEVPVGTAVHILNQPYKVGWYQGDLYAEVHPWLEGTPIEMIEGNRHMLDELIIEATKSSPGYQIDWSSVKTVLEKADGLPTKVGSH